MDTWPAHAVDYRLHVIDTVEHVVRGVLHGVARPIDEWMPSLITTPEHSGEALRIILGMYAGLALATQVSRSDLRVICMFTRAAEREGQ